MSERVAVLFRTHVWDDFVQGQAVRLCELSKGGHFYILADETRATLPATGFYKFSHCDADFEPLGLLRYWDTHLLWYNGDYPLYKVVSSLPHYDYYVMVEYDVVTNVDLAGLAQEAAADGVDAVIYNPHPVEPEWPWLDSCRAYKQEEVWRGLIPVVVLSRLAIEWLFTRRRKLTQQFCAGQLDRYPYCEAFVPTELMRAGIFKVQNLSHYGRTDRFEFWPPTLNTEVEEGADPAFLHPVLDARGSRPTGCATRTTRRASSTRRRGCGVISPAAAWRSPARICWRRSGGRTTPRRRRSCAR